MSVCCECCVLSEADHSRPTLCGVSSECDREAPPRLTTIHNRVQAPQEKNILLGSSNLLCPLFALCCLCIS